MVKTVIKKLLLKDRHQQPIYLPECPQSICHTQSQQPFHLCPESQCWVNRSEKKRTGVTIIGLESGNEHKPAATSGPNDLLQTNLPFTLFEALVWWAAIKDCSGYNEHLLAVTRHSLKGRKWSHLTLLIITAQYSTVIGQLFLLYLSDTHFKSSSPGRCKHGIFGTS